MTAFVKYAAVRWWHPSSIFRTKESPAMGADTHESPAGRELFQSLEVYLLRSGYEAIMSESAEAVPAGGPAPGTTGE